MAAQVFSNPYRPGAGHMPPHLAGREVEIAEFKRLLGQTEILENMVLTGLRGVGKTMLLDTLRPVAVQAGWAWVGTDLSEASIISDEKLCIRLLTDLAVVTSSISVGTEDTSEGFGFGRSKSVTEIKLDFEALRVVFTSTPGLPADKLKAVLELVWSGLVNQGANGLIFAYDEAQNLADHAKKEQHPLSLLLDVFQSIQKKGIPFMLVLTGLPTLFPKLVDARTFAERMFRVVFLDRLDREACREAIVRPLKDVATDVSLRDADVEMIVNQSGGYPYFIQFICREVYDLFLRRMDSEQTSLAGMDAIIRKLDTDFFAGRWIRATDRQRELLWVAACIKQHDDEFSVQEIVEKSNELLEKPFSASHANQMLAALGNAGLVYRNRHGKYSFAVPLLGQYILRQREEQDRRPDAPSLWD